MKKLRGQRISLLSGEICEQSFTKHFKNILKNFSSPCNSKKNPRKRKRKPRKQRIYEDKRDKKETIKSDDPLSKIEISDSGDLISFP